MDRAAVVALALLLAGCNAAYKNPANGDGNVAIDADQNGHVSFNLPFVQGQVKLPEGAMHNGNFDIDGVKLMPGSSVTGFSVDASDKGGTVHMAFTSPHPADDVQSYFRDQFKQKGIDVAEAGNALSGKSRDGSPFVIRVDPAGQGSQGTILIQSKS